MAAMKHEKMNKKQQQQQTLSWVTDSIHAYNSKERRNSVNKVICDARSYTCLFLSSNFFVLAALKLFAKYASTSFLVGDLIATDQSNADFIKNLDQDMAET